MTTTAVATPNRGAVARQQPAKPIDLIKHEVELRTPMIADLLPRHVSVQHFKASLFTAIGTNQNLLKCTMPSLIKACLEAAELGLSLNPSMKEGYIVPYGNQAQFQPSYIGLMKLARQNGEVPHIEARIVRDGDDFDHEFGGNKHITHKPKLGGTGDIIAAYCLWKLRDGYEDFDVMSRAEIDAIRKRSRSGSSGPWVTDYSEMCRKTVVRRASKYMPRSTEFANAIAIDEAADSGKAYSFEGGSVLVDDDNAPMDITDTAPQPTEKAAAQIDAVASRVAAAAPAVPRIEVTDGDWAGWSQRAVTAVRALKTRAEAKAWRDAHKQEWDDLEFNDAEAHNGLREALNAVGKAQGAG